MGHWCVCRMMTSMVPLVCLILSTQVHSYNVAFLVGDKGSHHMYMGRLAERFVDRGHNVIIVLPQGSSIPLESAIVYRNMTTLSFKCPHKMSPFSKVSKASYRDVISRPTLWRKLKSEMITNIENNKVGLCVLNDKHVMETLSGLPVDFYVIDVTISSFMLVPYSSNIPYAIVSTEYRGYLRRSPVLPSHIPSVLTPFSDKMTFYERLSNLFVEITSDYLYSRMELYDSSFEKTRYFDDLIRLPTKTVLQNACLCFLLRHSLLDFPTPRMPDVIPVGSVIARPAKPLPQHLKYVIDSYSSGVILVSFGSTISEVSNETLIKFMNTFRILPQGIVFRYDSNLTDTPRNVHFFKWLPQNDILGHSNVKLFISHCGMNSLIETTYHGTPMIAFPFYTDQHNNAALMQSRGIGEILDINDFTSEGLSATIKAILHHEKYSLEAKTLSKTYHDSLQFERNDPAFWVEHVIKYGTHYIRSRAYKMGEYRYFMFDVLGFGTFCIFIVIFVAAFAIYLITVSTGYAWRKGNSTIQQKVARKLPKRP